MSNRAEVAELLRELAAVMAEQRCHWYLFGAQAAILWGSARYSKDADVTVQMELAEIDGFIEAMMRHGFGCLACDHDFIEQMRVLRFVHRTTGVPLDIVLAGPGLEQDFLQRAVLVDVGGTHVPVISPEDLIITKILAGRPTDIQDVRGVILGRRPTLDVERIRSTLRLLEEALTRGDLLPVFEREWSEDPSP